MKNEGDEARLEKWGGPEPALPDPAVGGGAARGAREVFSWGKAHPEVP